MVAVNTGRNRRLGKIARHELQNRHLSRGVLHVDTVGLEPQVGVSTNTASIVGVAEQRLLDVVQVAVQDLLGQGQALLAEHATHFGVLVVELLVGGRERLDGGEISP